MTLPDKPNCFDAIQNKVRSHLAKCRGIKKNQKLVICFTDCWDSTKFQDNHYEGLLTLKKVDGVNFIFVLVEKDFRSM